MKATRRGVCCFARRFVTRQRHSFRNKDPRVATMKAQMMLCLTLARVRRWILATVAFGLLPNCGSGSAEQQGSGSTGGVGTIVGTGGASLSGGAPGAGGQSLVAGAPGSSGASVGNGGMVVSGGAGGA